MLGQSNNRGTRQTLCIALLLLGTITNARGDTGDSATGNYDNYMRLGYQFGYILKSNDFVRGQNLTGEPIDWFHAGRVEFGWQSTGREPWQQIWNYPAFALGFCVVQYEDEDELGGPFALYGTAAWPMFRGSRWSFSVEAGAGVSFGWNVFDPQTNPYNAAISSAHSTYVDVGFEYDYQVSRRFSLTGALTGTHFSNGGATQPNWGINQLGLMAWVKYAFQDQIRSFPRHEIPAYEKDWEILVQASAGKRQVSFHTADSVLDEEYLQDNYTVVTFSSTVNRQVSYKSKFGAGLDVVFDGATTAQLDAGDSQAVQIDDLPLEDQIRVGIFGSYEFVMHRYSAFVQIGYSVIQKEFAGQLPRRYERLGVKYYFSRHVYGGVSVRCHDFRKATHLEFNIGYAFRT
jgi:hypothetical protein